MHCWKRQPVELSCKEHFTLQCLGQIDRATESELLSQTLDPIQPYELDMPCRRSDSHQVQQISEHNPRPSPSARRLRTPGKLTGQRPQAQELVPPQSCADDGRS